MPSIFYRDLQKNYNPCHNRWQIYSVGIFHYYYRRIYSVGIWQGVLKYLPPMPQSPTDSPSVNTVGKTDGLIPSVKFSRGIFFWRALSSVMSSLFGFFVLPTELATEWEIIDDPNSNEQIPSVTPSVKILPTVLVPHTDEPNPSVKLFNGVV